MATKEKCTMRVTKEEYEFLKDRYEADMIVLLDGRKPDRYRIEVTNVAYENAIFKALDEFKLIKR